jgi:hypothetical protein
MNRNRLIFLLGGIGLAAMVLLLTGDWQQTAVFSLLYLLPTLTWSTRLPHQNNRAENLLIAAGLVLVLNALLTLLISYLPGAIPGWLLLLTSLLLTLAPLLRKDFGLLFPPSPQPDSLPLSGGC